jgi:hypothetical protein
MIAIQRLVRHGYDFRVKFGFGLNCAEQGSRVTFFSLRGRCTAILAGLRTLIQGVAPAGPVVAVDLL